MTEIGRQNNPTVLLDDAELARFFSACVKDLHSSGAAFYVMYLLSIPME